MSEEERYNNRQVERMLDQQSSDLKEHFSKEINPLTAQVTKTNGRVSFLEKTFWGAAGMFTLLTVWASWVTVQILPQEQYTPSLTEEDVQDAIENALKAYEINE